LPVAGLEPNYSAQASAALDMLESGTDDKLLNAVCDAIDLICDHSGDRRARTERLWQSRTERFAQVRCRPEIAGLAGSAPDLTPRQHRRNLLGASG